MTYGFIEANTFSARIAVSSPTYSYSSDEKLKTNITLLENSLDKILKLGGYTFNWKNKMDDRTHIGLIAQNVEKEFPELVSVDTITGYKTVEYGNMVAPLIEAVKEQQKQIEELKIQNEKVLEQNLAQQKQIDLLLKQIEKE